MRSCSRSSRLESCHFLDLGRARGRQHPPCSPRVRAKTSLGTGALAIKDGYGEVKSMFTLEAARGKGVAAALLRQIEDYSARTYLTALKLETGDTLHAAHRLYERNGFTFCGPFGDYVKPPKACSWKKRSRRTTP